MLAALGVTVGSEGGARDQVEARVDFAGFEHPRFTEVRNLLAGDAQLLRRGGRREVIS